jgi:arabinose-5-phosphate isomerase
MQIDEKTARDVMSAEPKTIDQDYLASFALQQMENYDITSLIVVDDGKHPIGVVHLHDLVKLGLQRR